MSNSAPRRMLPFADVALFGQSIELELLWRWTRGFRSNYRGPAIHWCASLSAASSNLADNSSSSSSNSNFRAVRRRTSNVSCVCVYTCASRLVCRGYSLIKSMDRRPVAAGPNKRLTRDVPHVRDDRGSTSETIARPAVYYLSDACSRPRSKPALESRARSRALNSGIIA